MSETPPSPDLASKQVFFFDRDGTLSLGNQPIEGARCFLDHLHAKGVRCLLMTNNSSRTPREHLERLNGLGLGLTADDVLVSTQPAIRFLRQAGHQRVFWVATAAVSEYIAEEGLTFDDEDPQAILLTYDTELDYDKITKLTRFVRAGVPYFATHTDFVCPMPGGPLPDVGTFIKMIETATGREPDKAFGKPDPAFVEGTLDALELGLGDAVIVGDRLYTDIAMARGNALTSVLVLTGETTREMADESDTHADLVVPDLEALIPYM